MNRKVYFSSLFYIYRLLSEEPGEKYIGERASGGAGEQASGRAKRGKVLRQRRFLGPLQAKNLPHLILLN